MNKELLEDIRLRYSEIFRRIDSLLELKDIVLVAVDGNCGSGKSTLAEALRKTYDCNIFHMDHFFLRLEQRTKERLEEAGGNVDYERFGEEVIAGIKSRQPFSYRIFDCKKMALGDYITVSPKKLNIIEGSYSMHPTLIDNYDLKVFLKLNGEEQKKRILRRNGEAGLEQFVTKWIPKENMYFEKMRIEEKCDLRFNLN